MKEYYRENADKQRAAWKAWLSVPENQERHKATRQKYWQSERGKDLKRTYKARTRQIQRMGDTVSMSDVLALHGMTCLFPGCESLEVEMDHVVPLSLGGTHTLDNLQPLCRKHNASKSNRSCADYRSVDA
jgi:5-methylcytosine-specific restriction endonuclease McrA